MSAQGDDNDEQARTEVNEFTPAQASTDECWIFDDCDLTCDLCEEAHGLHDGLVNIARIRGEGSDRATLWPARWFDKGQRVDEYAAALIGGDSACACMRLADKACLLRESHVIADRHRRDPGAALLDDDFGADGFVRVNVFGDDRTQRIEPAIIARGLPLSCSRAGTLKALTLITSECQ